MTEDGVMLALREMLMRSEFVPGQKLVAATLTERFSYLCMPVHHAFAVLERDALFASTKLTPSITGSYRQLDFHLYTAIVATSESWPMIMTYEVNNRLPLASPLAIAVGLSNLGDMASTLGEPGAQ